MQSQATTAPVSIAFVFPPASGHVNPSLPVARLLVELGHEVHYLCRPSMREAIEDTGATYHTDVDWETEMYATRATTLNGPADALKVEYGQDKENMFVAMCRLSTIGHEFLLPGLIRFLKHINAAAVVYCPFLSPEGAYAAHACGIPSISILTTAGPGSIGRCFEEFLARSQLTAEQLRRAMLDYQPHCEAVDRMNQRYNLRLPYDVNMSPIGKLEAMVYDAACLVTTSEDLQDPMTPELEESYRRDGTSFVWVGPLLDKAGVKRAGCHSAKADARQGKAKQNSIGMSMSDEELVLKVKEAKAAGRKVILSSMGTVITGDCQHVGWDALLHNDNGEEIGLSGRELCQSAWAGLIDAFGREEAEPEHSKQNNAEQQGHEQEGGEQQEEPKKDQKEPLLVMVLGPQPEPLGDIPLPANALAFTAVPQVDLLRAGVDLFLTHGGQNSFMEGLQNSTPLVVCPGFADQPVNGAKAEALGVGLCIPRPWEPRSERQQSMDNYRSAVRAAVQRVLEEPSFSSSAARCAARLSSSGGVPGAVEAVLGAIADRAVPAVDVEFKPKDQLANMERVAIAVGGA